MINRFSIVVILLGSVLGSLDAAEGPPKSERSGLDHDRQVRNDRRGTGSAIRKLREIRQEGGNAVAELKIEAEFGVFLEAQTKAGLGPREIFDAWGFSVWHEAQFETGANDLEWSLILYRSIYEQAIKLGRQDWVAHVRPNLSIAYGKVSKWAGLRGVINEGMEYLLSQGFDMDTRKMRDLGPWLPEIPEVRIRKFPMWVPNGKHVVPWQRKEQKDPTKPLFIDNLTMGLNISAAIEDYRQGDWQSTLERSLWAIKWSQTAAQQKSSATKSGVIARSRDVFYTEAIELQAYVLGQLRLVEKEEEILRACLTIDGETMRSNRSFTRIRMMVMLEELRLLREGADAALIERLDELIGKEVTVRGIGKKSMDHARVLKALGLIRIGKEEEGDRLLDKLRIENQRKYGNWLQVELAVLERKIEKKEFDGVKETLEELLYLLRERGQKIDELSIYEAYVKWAWESGNLKLAIQAQRELLRLLESFSIYTRLPLENARLAAILFEHGDREESAKLAEKANGLLKGAGLPLRMTREVVEMLPPVGQENVVARHQSKVIIQPLTSVTMALEGMPSRMVLTVANHGDGPAAGTLHLEGAMAAISFDEEMGRGIVRLGVLAGGPYVSPQISLSAQTSAIFECVAPPGLIPDGEVVLSWREAGKLVRECEWTILAAEEGVTNAVIDAGEYGDSPFHMIPVHHHLQSKGKELVNLRVVASKPCRVEMYDSSGMLQMVDFEGNGSLGDSGDWLGTDSDRDLSAEIPSDPQTGEARFFLQLDPAEANSGESLTIDVEWKVDGKWFVAARDTVLADE